MLATNPRLIASFAALALFAGVSAALPPVLAQDAPASTQPAGKSTLTVTVVDGTGAPVEGVHVMLMAASLKPAGGTAIRGDRPKPLKGGTTDSSGKATLSDIADGNYSVVARLRGKGNGRTNVTVASADADVSVTLKPGKHHGGPAADKPATQPA